MNAAHGGIVTLEDLARALRQLRRREARRHGQRELTYRELAAKTGWSVSIIGAYFTGKALPPTDRFDILTALLGANAAEQGGLATARDRVAEHRQVRTPPAERAPARPAAPVNLLPAEVRGFAGRVSQLGELDALLPGDGRTVRLVTVSGSAGVGKTALVVHWAHRVAHQFPGGQLYVDLRGFDPAGSPMKPADAVRGFLNALDVPAHQIPTDPGEQVALYRALLAHRRVLVVLDNARDAAQVRPLLPGASSAVVVTSRIQLTALVATAGAYPVAVGLLNPVEAWDLLGRRLGTERLTAEPDAVEKIIERCAGLPLALAIIAAHAVTDRGHTLAALADDLAEAGRRLDTLNAGDDAADVRAVFSWSCRALRPATARMFQLLGLHPGQEIGVRAAASLTGERVDEAQRQLAELAHANLIVEHTPGRYRVHDLLRAYAVELSRTHDGEAAQRAAVRRLLDFCVRTTEAANVLLEPGRELLPARPPEPGAAAQDLPDSQAALSWLTTEYPALRDAVALALDLGLDEQACQLAWMLGTFCRLRVYWTDWAAIQEAALPAAYRLAEPLWQARLHRELAYAYASLDRYEASQAQFEHALERYGTLADHIGLSRAHRGICLMFERQGRYAEALEHARRSRDLLLQTDDQPGKAYAYNSVGWYHALVGDFPDALDNCRRAVTLLAEVGDRLGEATAWDSVGYVHHHLGQYREALTCYDRALETFRELGDRYYEADTLVHVGDTHQATADGPAAREAWQRALAIFEDLGRSEAAEVRTKLKESGYGH
jgi:tetratricopeptide (TPR) repeat protein